MKDAKPDLIWFSIYPKGYLPYNQHVTRVFQIGIPVLGIKIGKVGEE